MRGKIARKLRAASGGQEVSTHREYGYVKMPTKINIERAYDITLWEKTDIFTGKKSWTSELNLKLKNFKISPLRLMSQGRARYQALKKNFKIISRQGKKAA